MTRPRFPYFVPDRHTLASLLYRLPSGSLEFLVNILGDLATWSAVEAAVRVIIAFA